MKLLFDQNLSPKLVDFFSEHFDDCQHTQNLGYGDSDDKLVWEYAKNNGYTIVTKDSDFNHFVSFFGFPPKVVWIRRGNCSTKIITKLLLSNLKVINNFINDSENGVLTIY